MAPLSPAGVPGAVLHAQAHDFVGVHWSQAAGALMSPGVLPSVNSGYSLFAPESGRVPASSSQMGSSGCSPDGGAALELLISALWLSPLSHPVFGSL